MNHLPTAAGLGPRRDQSKEEFWRAAFRQCAASGQTISAFCRQRRLAPASFYAWRRTLAAREAAGTERRPPSASVGPGVPASGLAPAPAFVPVQLRDPAAGVIEILLAGGRCLRLHGPVDYEALVEVVAALECQA